jgi:predicted CopG family antitoxin
MNQLRGLAQKEGMMEGKIRSSEEHINKFKGVIHSVEKMKFEELMRLKSDVGSPALKDGTRSFSEAILLYAASKSG